MPSNLKTDFKRIGRSGPTVDGRVIKPEAIDQAAKNYSKDLFTAMVWPEHFRWFNMGVVEALRAEDNSEGGRDLYAQLAPNDYYLQANANGQKLFTSMELRPNFRGSGEYYMVGLAATDDPASAATSEMRFSRTEQKDSLAGDYIEQGLTPIDNDEQPPSWLTKLFKNNPEADMSTEAIAKLQADLTALTDKFTALGKAGGEEKPNDGNQDDDSGSEGDDFTKLTETVEALAEKFSQFEKKIGKGETDEALHLAALKTSLDELTTKFNAALEEQPGTTAGENSGGEDLKQYI